MATRKKVVKTRVTIWLPLKLAQKFRALAVERGRTQSWYMTSAVRGIVEKKGGTTKSD